MAFEKGGAVTVEGRPWIDLRQRRIRVDGSPPRRVEHLDAHPRRLVGGNAGAGKGRVGPIRGDHRQGLALDQRGDLGLPLFQVAIADDAVSPQPFGVSADRIAARTSRRRPRDPRTRSRRGAGTPTTAACRGRDRACRRDGHVRTCASPPAQSAPARAPRAPARPPMPTAAAISSASVPSIVMPGMP